MKKIIQQQIIILMVLGIFGCAAWKPSGPKETQSLLDEGKKLYVQGCIWCHGPDGNGKCTIKLTKPPSNFAKPLDQWKHTHGETEKIFNAITNGVVGTSMAKFRYTEDERWALTYAVKDFSLQESANKSPQGKPEENWLQSSHIEQGPSSMR